jgi:hypothetical protein
MKTLPIDKGVPIPQSDIYTETIKALKVGDSFVLHFLFPRTTFLPQPKKDAAS